MKNEELLRYLEMVLDLELQKTQIFQILTKIESQHYYVEKKPLLSEHDIKHNCKIKNRDYFSIICGIIGFLIGASAPLHWRIIAMIVGPLIGTCIGASLAESRAKREIAQNKAIIARALTEKNNRISAENAKSQAETYQKNKLVKFASDKLNELYKQTEYVLDDIYSANYIYPKYRHLNAIAAIYEYLDSEQCNTLIGHNGAYATFELNSRLDHISSTLNSINLKMNSVIENQQKMIYNQHVMINNQTLMLEHHQQLNSTLKNMDSTLNKVSNDIESNTKKLDEISFNATIAAYTAQVIERNQYYKRDYTNNRSFYDRINL